MFDDLRQFSASCPNHISHLYKTEYSQPTKTEEGE